MILITQQRVAFQPLRKRAKCRYPQVGGTTKASGQSLWSLCQHLQITVKKLQPSRGHKATLGVQVGSQILAMCLRIKTPTTSLPTTLEDTPDTIQKQWKWWSRMPYMLSGSDGPQPPNVVRDLWLKGRMVVLTRGRKTHVFLGRR